MRSSIRLLALGLAMLLAPEICGAQSTLGELLDAGAKRIKPADFKRDVVQHTLIGPTNTGAPMEVMYVTNGSIAGKGGSPLEPADSFRNRSPLSGEWTIDDAERVCTALRIGTIVLPQRCQYWFKLGDAYYISDSDGDRQSKVLRRSIKEGSASTAMPSNLGELLDAGARRVSAVEFKRDVVQRTLVGFWSAGSGIEMMYVTNGSIQGLAQPSPQYPWNTTVRGDWSIGEAEKICTAMQLVGGTNNFSVRSSCQVWFKLGEDYFIADSDVDRRAQVLRRAIKR